jgi:hypothetical protein
MACVVQGGGGGAGSCGAMSVFLECERCPAVFSNPNGLASPAH